MSLACDQALDGVGAGVAASLRAVDCVANDVTTEAFGRLFAPGGALVPVLTILLTLYVAFFAISLMLGRSRLGVRSLTPRMITLGLVLTFATSWLAYQSVVWNLAIGGPDWLATVLTGSDGSATTVFADKLDVVFLAIQQASQGQEADVSAFSPAGIMWLGAMLLLLGTVGLLVTARIALAVLVALGPILVVMALFNGTRGLFTGWLKGVVMLALTPVFAVLGGSVMLEIAVPVLAALTATPGEVNPQAAMAFFMIGAVHCALMFMVVKVTATMVGGWTVFGLVPDKTARDEPLSAPAPAPLAQPIQPREAQQPAPLPAPRRVEVAGATPAVAANDTGPAQAQGANRETPIVSTASGGAQLQPLSNAASRTRGIGNRFRSAGSRPTEKVT